MTSDRELAAANAAAADAERLHDWALDYLAAECEACWGDLPPTVRAALDRVVARRKEWHDAVDAVRDALLAEEGDRP